MRKRKNEGVMAMQREGYHLPQKAERLHQHCDEAWWQNKWVTLALVIFLSILDAVTLYTVIDEVITENELINRMMTFGLALCLNFIPLIAGYLIREKYYDRSRVPGWSLAALLATFLLLWGATVYLRAETSALNFKGAEDTFVNAVAAEAAAADPAAADLSKSDEGVATALTTLFSVMPLVTSIINLYLGYIIDDPVKKQLRRLRMRRLELDAYKADLLAARDEMIGQDRMRVMLELNRARYHAAVRKTNSVYNGIEAFARFWLGQVLADPKSISKLSADALKCGVPVEHQMDLEPEDLFPLQTSGVTAPEEAVQTAGGEDLPADGQEEQGVGADDLPADGQEEFPDTPAA